MNNLKRLFAVVLVLAMALSMAVVGNAASYNETTAPGNYPKGTPVFTAEIAADTENEHDFYVYQVLVGDLLVEYNLGNKEFLLSNIEWGADVNNITLKNNVNNSSIAAHYAGVTSASQFAEKLSSSSHQQLMASLIQNSLSGAGIHMVKAVDGRYVLPGGTKLAPGYYLFVDKISLAGNTPSRTLALVAGDISTDVKSQSVPTVRKEVNDVDDTNAAEVAGVHTFNSTTPFASIDGTNWADTADHDVGDTIIYQLNATLPDETGTVGSYNGYGQFTHYKVIFHDTMCKGLAPLNGMTTSALPVINDTDPDSDKIAAATAWYTANETQIKNYIRIFVGQSTSLSSIYTEYRLLPKALYDKLPESTGALNKWNCFYYDIQPAVPQTTAEYVQLLVGSNNVKPFTQPNDHIKVFYKADLTSNAVVGYNKADKNGNPNKVYLEYTRNPILVNDTANTKEDKTRVWTWELDITKVVAGTTTELAGAQFALYKYNPGTADYDVLCPVVTSGDTKFLFKGIDDGRYMLKETVTPAGYNTLEDIYFVVTANHVLNGAVDPDMNWVGVDPDRHIDLSVQRTDKNGTIYADAKEQTFNQSDKNSNGAIEVNVENHRGVSLPSTGGVGTTLFYVIGAAMALVAAVLLIAKKRMNNTEQ